VCGARNIPGHKKTQQNMQTTSEVSLC
jgi:hypothetical protein